MSTDRLDVLGERNELLLKQLKLQREKLEKCSGCSESRKRGREDVDEDGRASEVTVTRTDVDSRPARAALAKPSVSFTDKLETHREDRKMISTPSRTSNHRGVTTDHTTVTEPVKDRHRDLQGHDKLPDRRPFATKSCQVGHTEAQTEVQSPTMFQSDKGERQSASFRHHLQPLLGYDWIAGVLDTEDSLVERSDEFFNDLRMFRLLNKDECVHDTQADFFEESHRVPPVRMNEDNQETNTDSHQCTFSYRINSRLFPVPLHSQECCPVCKKHKTSHPHTAAEPALIRVSIPRSAILPPYKYKAHRRCSFDPSDSLGLPSHCLSGWSNTGQNTLPPPSSLDLRSNLKTKSSVNKDLEELSASKGDPNTDQIAGVSRLARYNFQHFTPKRKMGATTYPVS